MINSEKYEYIEVRLADLTKDGHGLQLGPAIIKDIVSELMKLSKSRENPDTLPDDIRDTYHRLYG